MEPPMTVSAKTHSFSRGIALAALFSLLAFVPGFSTAARAQDHLVSPQALQQQMQTASAARRQNIDTLNSFLSIPAAAQAMKTARVNPTQVRNAIPTLSSHELASLASRAQKAQQQFSAGMISNGMLLVVIVAIVVVIVVIAIH